VHEILASSNGKLSVRHGAGQVRDFLSSQVFGDVIVQILGILNPTRKSQNYMNLECIIYDVGIENGVASVDNFALQTDKVTMLAKGNVDFESEALSISMRAKPREGIGISIGGVANSFLRLGGTLQDPKLQVDAASSVTTTGAAVATGGLSLLARGLWDRATAQIDICKNQDAIGVGPQ
jgi:hypothetical protein